MEPDTKRQPIQSRGQETRRKLVEAALELFKKQGYLNTTARHISEAAGVSIGSFYVYFREKKEVFAELMELYFREFQNLGIRALLEESQEPERRHAKLKELIRNFFDFSRSMGSFYTDVNLLANQDEQIRKEILDFDSKVTCEIKQILEQLPNVHKGSDPEANAFLLYAFIDLTINRLQYPVPLASLERIQEEMATLLERMLFNGQ